MVYLLLAFTVGATIGYLVKSPIILNGDALREEFYRNWYYMSLYRMKEIKALLIYNEDRSTAMVNCLIDEALMMKHRFEIPIDEAIKGGEI